MEHRNGSINTDEISISPPPSPYSRRYPPNERFKFRAESDRKPFEMTIEEANDWTAHQDDRPENNRNQDDVFLPVEMFKPENPHSVRNRRDPHFQGVRARKSKRVICKNGDRNIGLTNIPRRSWRFFKDFVTTLIDEQWRYTLAVFALTYFLSWLFFAVLWNLIAYAHGDLKFDAKTGERLGDGKMPCIRGATTFAGFLLLSIETQVSTGYGEKYPNEECPEAIFLMIVQLVTGVVIDGAMVGIVYAKMVRPPKRPREVRFAKNAVVCQRDGSMSLVFRVCDPYQTHVIKTKVKAFLIEDHRSLEGERLGKVQRPLKLVNKGRALLLWPATMCHTIDEQSPLYDFSAKDLLERKFEIILTITGSSRATGQITQSRTSYLPREILWGYRFANVVSYDEQHERYVAHNDRIDTTEIVDTPLCSAKRLQEVLEEVQHFLATEQMADYSDPTTEENNSVVMDNDYDNNNIRNVNYL